MLQKAITHLATVITKNSRLRVSNAEVECGFALTNSKDWVETEIIIFTIYKCTTMTH